MPQVRHSAAALEHTTIMIIKLNLTHKDLMQHMSVSVSMFTR